MRDARGPTAFQRRTLWNAATGVALLVLGALVVGLIWLVGQVFGLLQPVLVPVLVAGIVAYLLDPVVRRLQRWGLSRTKSVTLVFVAMLLMLLLLVLAVLPGVNRARHLLAQQMQSAPSAHTTTSEVDAEAQQEAKFVAKLADMLREQQRRHRGDLLGWVFSPTDDQGREVIAEGKAQEGLDFFWQTRLGRLLYAYKDLIWKWTTSGTSKLLALLGLMLGMVMVPVYLFFFLNDAARIEQHWHDYVPLKASRFKSELVETLQEINGYLISFFRGQVLVAMIDGILVGIALTFYDLPYGFLIGIFMALLGVIPYIGNIICLIPALTIAWFHGHVESPFGLDAIPYASGVLLIFIGVQQINSLVTAPKIVGDSVGLHPMTVIFSMLFWTVVLGGFVGALLAVPLSAAIKVLFRRFIWERQLKEPLTQGSGSMQEDANQDALVPQ